MGATISTIKQTLENLAQPAPTNNAKKINHFGNGLAPRHPFPGVKYDFSLPMKSAPVNSKLVDLTPISNTDSKLKTPAKV